MRASSPFWTSLFPKKMSKLFLEKLETWEDWDNLPPSHPAFIPLAERIIKEADLSAAPLLPLPPATNRVFRCGDAVLKIYFPKETGCDPTPDFTHETAVCKEVNQRGIPTSKLLSSGIFQDTYAFYYIIESFCPGIQAKTWLKSASCLQRENFAVTLQKHLQALHHPAPGLLPENDLLSPALNNPRLQKLSLALQEEFRCRAKKLDFSNRVLVHGDLNSGNILVSDSSELYLIDWADAQLAPWWYDVSSLALNLFSCRKEMLRPFAGNSPENFASLVIDSLVIHDFGPDLFLTCCEEQKTNFSSLQQLENFLISALR